MYRLNLELDADENSRLGVAVELAVEDGAANVKERVEQLGCIDNYVRMMYRSSREQY